MLTLYFNANNYAYIQRVRINLTKTGIYTLRFKHCNGYLHQKLTIHIHIYSMKREEHLEFCSVCKKRSFDRQIGIVCSLTEKIADFEGNCLDFEEDEQEKELEEAAAKSRVSDTNRVLNKSRISLFVVGGLYAAIGIYEGFFMIYHDILYGIIDWTIAAIFIGLGIWSYKKPYLALLIGLCVYIGLIVLFAAIEPSTLVSGIIWKLLIIFYLITGINTAKRAVDKQKYQNSDLLDEI